MERDPPHRLNLSIGMLPTCGGKGGEGRGEWRGEEGRGGERRGEGGEGKEE